MRLVCAGGGSPITISDGTGMADDEHYPAQAPLTGAGPRLKVAREAAGLSVAQISAQTKIPGRMLALIGALESRGGPTIGVVGGGMLPTGPGPKLAEACGCTLVVGGAAPFMASFRVLFGDDEPLLPPLSDVF